MNIVTFEVDVIRNSDFKNKPLILKYSPFAVEMQTQDRRRAVKEFPLQ